MGYIYLATPYTHTDKSVMQARYQQACDIAGQLLQKGVVVYSPIVHCHVIAQYRELPTNWDYWKRFDTVMIKSASKLVVAKMPGWQESKGVSAEIQIAKEIGILVEYLEV